MRLENIVVDVAFKLFIDNIELIDNEFQFAIVAYTLKSGLLITVEFQSDWKLVVFLLLKSNKIEN